ncbi:MULTISPECIES: hypothetical protein [unclassified Mesorhizobium]|nr:MULTISPECIES: hypothetical protein [unclassified Mesorhizobium]
MIKIAEALMRASTPIDMPNVGMPRWSVALAILHDAEGGASSMWNISKAAVFWAPKEIAMIRWLVRIGALYAAYKLGEAAGRSEQEVIPLPPSDRQRQPGRQERTDLGVEPS